MPIDIEIKMPEWAQSSEELKRDMHLVLAATMQTNRGLLFKHGGAWNGHQPWKSLATRDGVPLSNRGTLAQSIGPTNDGITPQRRNGGIVKIQNQLVTIGTNLAYARVQNDGAIIRPKGGEYTAYGVRTKRSSKERTIHVGTPRKRKFLRYWNARLGRYSFARQVIIPARPFDDMNDRDIDEIEATMAGYIAGVINNA